MGRFLDSMSAGLGESSSDGDEDMGAEGGFGKITGPRIEWRSPPIEYKMERQRVHIWRALFRQGLACMGRLFETLSQGERERAGRLRPEDRERFIFAHGMLRRLLGPYVGCPPQYLVFKYNEYGKPFLSDSVGSQGIQFNLSHSDEMTLVAVTEGKAVGIDVERMRRIPDIVQMVSRFFSPGERNFLNSLGSAEFMEGFFAIWTAKEAFLKGIGKGLSLGLDTFTLNFLAGESRGLISIDDDADACSWKVIRLFPGPEYSGALAVKELGTEPQFFEYS